MVPQALCLGSNAFSLKSLLISNYISAEVLSAIEIAPSGTSARRHRAQKAQLARRSMGFFNVCMAFRFLKLPYVDLPRLSLASQILLPVIASPPAKVDVLCEVKRVSKRFKLVAISSTQQFPTMMSCAILGLLTVGNRWWHAPGASHSSLLAVVLGTFPFKKKDPVGRDR